MSALALATAAASYLPGFYATPGKHSEHAGCAFLRTASVRFYISLGGWRKDAKAGVRECQNHREFAVVPDALSVARAVQQFLKGG